MDLVVLSEQRDVTREEAQKFADDNGLIFLECSAKTCVETSNGLTGVGGRMSRMLFSRRRRRSSKTSKTEGFSIAWLHADFEAWI